MGIRIRPADIEVPEKDPFKNDLLHRKEPAEILTKLVDTIEGPCVLAVDAAWGAGKTTFLRIWSRHLRNQGFPVVRFNAWETDHAGDPFVSLVSELTEGLREYSEGSLAEKISDTTKAAQQVAIRAVPSAIRILTAGLLDIQPLIEREAGQFLSSLAERGLLKKYRDAQDSIHGFRTKLQEMANKLAECERHPLIVMVDELDRCRPSYAVELIEVAKHFFGVDHIVFVLAVNRTELSHSVKALYGNEFDAIGYLRRFIDVDFRLPDPDRIGFISEQLKGVLGEGEARDLLQAFLSASNLSLRQVGQATHRLRLVAASFASNPHLLKVVVSALIMRTIDPEIYRRFVRGTASDKEAVEAIFERIEIALEQRCNHSDMYKYALFEGTIIMCYKEIESRTMAVESDTLDESPLMTRYHKMIKAGQPEGVQPTPDSLYARTVTEAVNYYRRGGARYLPFGFQEAVRRIELLARIDVP